MRRTPYRPRAGFTLVELLVVMTIIAILVALTSAAVSRAIIKSDELRNRNEISQLAAAVEQFKTEFAVQYLPSRIILPPGYDPTGESLQYISSLWPRINTQALQANSQAFPYWNMSGTQPVTLTGDQCLVFFLGGLRDSSNNSLGFSTNPLSPLDPPKLAGESRKGPFFNFPPARLQVFDHNKLNAVETFPSFVDTYGTLPYLYFSTRKTANDYPTLASNGTYTVYPAAIVVPNGPTYQVYPYQQSGPVHNQPAPATPIRVWMNKSSFQIISGGRNTAFGEGGISWPGYIGATGTPGAATLDGSDDMSNFYPTLLGVGNQ